MDGGCEKGTAVPRKFSLLQMTSCWAQLWIRGCFLTRLCRARALQVTPPPLPAPRPRHLQPADQTASGVQSLLGTGRPPAGHQVAARRRGDGLRGRAWAGAQRTGAGPAPVVLAHSAPLGRSGTPGAGLGGACRLPAEPLTEKSPWEAARGRAGGAPCLRVGAGWGPSAAPRLCDPGRRVMADHAGCLDGKRPAAPCPVCGLGCPLS